MSAGFGFAFGFGLAAVGRPAHIKLDYAADFAGGHFDAARSYDLAEVFLGEWLATHSARRRELSIGSKWGYRYMRDTDSGPICSLSEKYRKITPFWNPYFFPLPLSWAERTPLRTSARWSGFAVIAYLFNRNPYDWRMAAAQHEIKDPSAVPGQVLESAAQAAHCVAAPPQPTWVRSCPTVPHF